MTKKQERKIVACCGTVLFMGAVGLLLWLFQLRAYQPEQPDYVEIVMEETRIEDAVRDADLVVTGEGRLDEQTAMGKAPIGVARLAKRYGRKVIAFSGCATAGASVVNGLGIDAFFPILRQVTTLDEALEKGNAAANLAATAEQVFRCFRLGAH